MINEYYLVKYNLIDGKQPIYKGPFCCFDEADSIGLDWIGSKFATEMFRVINITASENYLMVYIYHGTRKIFISWVKPCINGKFSIEKVMNSIVNSPDSIAKIKIMDE